jgi:hypothetical protein
MSPTIHPPKKRKPGVCPFFVRNVPRQLKANWKGACAKRNVPMKLRVEQWMRRDIEDELHARPFAKSAEDAKR